MGGREEIVEGLELMPDAMYRALEDIVELVVDGDYEELGVVSRNRLGVEDLRRRVEDDCPEPLVLPPRGIYRVEVIAKSDDPDMPGWAYFLDLWTEPARRACTPPVKPERVRVICVPEAVEYQSPEPRGLSGSGPRTAASCRRATIQGRRVQAESACCPGLSGGARSSRRA